MKKNLLKSFLSFSVGNYINIFIGLLTVPITTRMLSPEQYGVSSFFLMITNILATVCSLSLEQGFIRFFYDESKENRGKLLYNCLVYSVLTISLISILIYLYRDAISIYIIGKKDRFFWLLLLLSVIFTILKTYSLIVIRMQQKGKLYSFFNVLLRGLEFIFILTLFNFYGNNYETLVLAALFSMVITTLFSILSEKEIWCFKGEMKVKRQELLKYSFPLAMTMALTWLFSSSDKIAIKMYSNMQEMGLYAGAFKIISLISTLQIGFSSFWTPTTYEHYTNNPEDLNFFKKANDYLSLVFLILGIGLLLTRNIIILLLGKNYYPSIFIMPMLLFNPIMYLISETTMLGIDFKKKTIYSLYISIIVVCINMLGNILLVPYLGARGAAISTGISYIIFFSLRTYFSIRLINFGFELKRIYIVTLFMLLYALFLTFYSDLLLEVSIGILLLILVIYIYFPVIKEVIEIYKKRKIPKE